MAEAELAAPRAARRPPWSDFLRTEALDEGPYREWREPEFYHSVAFTTDARSERVPRPSEGHLRASQEVLQMERLKPAILSHSFELTGTIRVPGVGGIHYKTG